MKVMTVVGARPQFIKAAVLGRELARRECVECLVHTGQHYDYAMSDIFFDQLGIREPSHRLNVGSGSHGYQTGEMMQRLEPVVGAEQPDVILVFGDTNTTLAGALVAAKLSVPLGHVEAGLRSFNRAMPEEINRVVADHVSQFLFAPSTAAARQLEREGIAETISVVGDLMVDLVVETSRSLPSRPPVLERLGLNSKSYAVATIHRAANTDVEGTFSALVAGLRGLPFPVVLPAHPRTVPLARRYGLGRGDNIILCEPVSYADMIALQRDARVVLTDSGGMQKEACVLGVPCVTLRTETEWPETVESGWNALAGSDPRLICALATRRVPEPAPRPLYGDGRCAERIVDVLTGRRLAQAV